MEFDRARDTDIRQRRGARDPQLAEWVRVTVLNHVPHDAAAESYLDTFHPDAVDREALKRAFEDGLHAGRY